MDALVGRYVPTFHDELIAKIPGALRPEVSPLLADKIQTALKLRIAAFLRTRSGGDWSSTFRTQFLPAADDNMLAFGRDVADQLETKIPGDQRENILQVWLGSLARREL